MHTFTEAAAAWRAENPQRTERWKATEARFLAWFAQRIGLDPIDSITRERVEQLRAELAAAPWSPKTVNHHLATLRAVLRAAVERGWLPAAPRVRPLKVIPRVRWLTESQAGALLLALPPGLRAMTIFSLETGLRKANVAGLRWDWLDLAHGLLCIPALSMKNRRAHALPLSDAALEIVKAQRGRHPVFVFVSRIGQPYANPARLAWRRAVAAAGLTDFRWHDLRHTWASWKAQSGAPLYVLKQLGGWACDTMPALYTHMSVDHLRPWLNRGPAHEFDSRAAAR